MKGTVAIATLGCKTNQFESAGMEERLRDAGYRVVPFEAGADLVLINTCTVTAATDKQSRNLVRRARRLNVACRVVVTGCYAQVNPEELRVIPGVALVLGNQEKLRFLELLEGGAELVQVSPARDETDAAPLTVSYFAERSRAFVQIQNGCDAFCSYCIIPYARGRSRSVPVDEVVDQVRKLVEGGYPEIVLTGIHIGGYGLDLVPATTLLELLRRLSSLTGVRRLRLGSLEPTELPDELIEELAGSRILCPHLHLPLQAGSDRVLQRMNRHYDTPFFRNLVEKVHRRLPDGAIGLDVIAGFPGETNDDHNATLAMIESLPVSHLHVFPFSRRPGTPAATLPDQLSGDLIKERAAQLRTLGDRKREIFARRFIGERLEVVVEGGPDPLQRRGVTRNYLVIRFSGTPDLIGETAWVLVMGWQEGELWGELT